MEFVHNRNDRVWCPKWMLLVSGGPASSLLRAAGSPNARAAGLGMYEFSCPIDFEKSD